jgi:hypothetical protein
MANHHQQADANQETAHHGGKQAIDRLSLPRNFVFQEMGYNAL